MAFNTFLYTPELRINIHLYTTTTLAFPSGFNSHFTSLTHLLPAFVLLLTPHSNPPKHYCGNFSRAAAQHTSIHDETAPVWMFWWSSHLFFFCNLIFGMPLRRGNGHKGGEVKVQNPRLGGLWWSAWELEKGKLWLEYEWNRRRGGEERGKKRGEEKGGLWLNYSPHHGAQRRTFTRSAQAWTPLLTLSDAQDRVMDTGPRLVRTGVSIKSGSNRKERAAGLGERSGKSHFWLNSQSSRCWPRKVRTSEEDLINFSLISMALTHFFPA